MKTDSGQLTILLCVGFLIVVYVSALLIVSLPKRQLFILIGALTQVIPLILIVRIFFKNKLWKQL